MQYLDIFQRATSTGHNVLDYCRASKTVEIYTRASNNYGNRAVSQSVRVVEDSLSIMGAWITKRELAVARISQHLEEYKEDGNRCIHFLTVGERCCVY
jgi:hypothetical protein